MRTQFVACWQWCWKNRIFKKFPGSFSPEYHFLRQDDTSTPMWQRNAKKMGVLGNWVRKVTGEKSLDFMTWWICRTDQNQLEKWSSCPWFYYFICEIRKWKRLEDEMSLHKWSSWRKRKGEMVCTWHCSFFNAGQNTSQGTLNFANSTKKQFPVFLFLVSGRLDKARCSCWCLCCCCCRRGHRRRRPLCHFDLLRRNHDRLYGGKNVTVGCRRDATGDL